MNAHVNVARNVEIMPDGQPVSLEILVIEQYWLCPWLSLVVPWLSGCPGCPVPLNRLHAPSHEFIFSRPQVPVKAAVLNGLSDVFQAYLAGGIQVGNGAGDLQYLGIRPRGQGKGLNR